MTKRRIEIGDELLERAKALLGTSTKSETVDKALRWVLSPPRPGTVDGLPVERERDDLLEGFGER